MTNVMSSRSSCFYEAVTAAEAVTRSGGSVLKAPQRRRGGTPPRSETAKLRKNPYLCILMRENPVFSPPRAETGAYRHPSPCILMHEKPRVFSPHGEEDTGS